eukprot:CAMPEP_0116575216 /NCGR_PEP_ID=MMETSP0397-20121206/19834_1 /TAXON_ID=216820 /ORGANISM="Cyclophora tenuis, Strain ECT3854" /LENGTH=200 /DNA_ID=CAMNT_0004104083 /DNA_START=410 /DNA_END=1012 /DNA_ORIENTATION=+
MIRKATRQVLGLRAGQKHTVDIILFLRAKDIEWFHSKTEHKQEFYDLLSERVMPKVFEAELKQQQEKEKDGPKAGKKQKSKQKNQRGEPNKKRKRSTTPVPASDPAEKPKRKVTHVFGSELQLTYKSQLIDQHDGVTLYMAEGDELKFREYQKLGKRILVWCFPLNKYDPMEPDPSDGGFPRPELIPLADIFREPPDNDD